MAFSFKLKGKKVFIYGSGSIVAFMMFLLSLNYIGIDIQTSPDIKCSYKCVSYFTIKIENVSLCGGVGFKGVYFDKEDKLERVELYKADRRYNETNPERWKRYDFSELKGKCLDKGVHEFMIVGYKKNPSDTIKWGVGYGLKDADPYWFGTGIPELYYNESLGHSATSEISGSIEKLSMRFTPSSGAYLFIAKANLYHASSSYASQAWFVLDNVFYGKTKYQPASNINRMAFIEVLNATLNSSQHTAQVKFNSTSGEARINDTRIVGFKLSSYDKVYQNDAQTSMPSSMSNLDNFTFTIDAAGEYLVFVRAESYGAGTYTQYYEVNSGGSTYCSGSIRITNDEMPFLCIFKRTFSTGVNSVALRGYGTSFVTNRRIAVIKYPSSYYFNESLSEFATINGFWTTTHVMNFTDSGDFIIIASGYFSYYSSIYLSGEVGLWVDGVPVDHTQFRTESGNQTMFFISNNTFSPGMHEVKLQCKFCRVSDQKILALKIASGMKPTLVANNGTYNMTTNNLKIYLDDASGIDKSGNGTVVSLSSISARPGFFGQGMEFNGVGSWVDLGSSWAPKNGTISMRFKLNSTNNQDLISKINLECGIINQYLNCTMSNSTNKGSVKSLTTINKDKWYWMAFNWNSSGLFLWLDGVYQGSDTSFVTGLQSNAQPMVLGTSGVSLWLNGTIDEFRYYEPQINQTDILFTYLALNRSEGTSTSISCSVQSDLMPNLKLYRNETLVSNPDVQTLSPGYYYYTCNVTGGLNFASLTFPINIYKLPPPLPQWSNNETNYPSPTSWNWTRNTGFSIYCNATPRYNVSLFEANFTGSFVNYTTTRGSNMNQSIFNFTGIPAGNYLYRWYCNDSSNNFNVTPQWLYKVNKINTNITIEFNQTVNSNRTYEKGESINITAIFFTVSGYNYDYPGWYLYVNDVSVCSAEPGNTWQMTCYIPYSNLAAGYYKVNGTSTETQNYSFTSNVKYVIVSYINFTFGSSSTNMVRFTNCSPDWTWYPSQPQNQTNSLAIFNVSSVNVTSNIMIRYTGTLNSGWKLYFSNDSTNKITEMSTSYKNVWYQSPANQWKQIWLYANCSNVTQNPGVSIEIKPG